MFTPKKLTWVGMSLWSRRLAGTAIPQAGLRNGGAAFADELRVLAATQLLFDNIRRQG
jgi:hypothetical protein